MVSLIDMDFLLRAGPEAACSYSPYRGNDIAVSRLEVAGPASTLLLKYGARGTIGKVGRVCTCMSSLGLTETPVTGAAGIVEEAVVSTFSSMCGCDTAARREAAGAAPCDSIIAVISLVGDSTWTLVFHFPRDTAFHAAIAFSGFEIPYESPDMGDVVGEIANAVAGDAAARLEAAGWKVEISLPAVARGSDLESLRQAGTPSLVMGFASSVGDFTLHLQSSSSTEERP
jgi:CheY-specific phosphatase CheX